MRRTLLPVAAVLCIACMGVGAYLFTAALPARGGLGDLLARAGGNWPATARALFAFGAAFAIATGAFRVDRTSWRAGIGGALAWAGFGVMAAVWVAVMPARAPGWEWSAGGVAAGLAIGAVGQWFMGFVGFQQALRDLVLLGVFGYTMAWAVAPLIT